jgi:hypothetical protein
MKPESAQLLHHPREVLNVPRLNDLAIADAVYVHVRESGGLASRGATEKLARVRPDQEPILDHVVLLGYFALDLDPQVGKPGAERTDDTGRAAGPEDWDPDGVL